MLNLPSLRFTTACSNPDDFVKTSKDLDDGNASGLGKVMAALASAAVLRKCRRFAGLFMMISWGLVLSGVAVGVRTAGKSRKDAFGRPAQLAHADFGGIVGTRNPVFKIIEMLVVRGSWRRERCQQVAELFRIER